MTRDQLVAATDLSDRIAVIACPGSGKTTTMVEAIRRDIGNGAPLHAIAAITYTNAAANILKERLGATPGYCGTLHGFCLRFMQHVNPRTTLIDEQEAEKVLQMVAKTLGYKGTDKALSDARQSFWSKKMKLGNYTEAERVVLSYAATLQKESLLEYDLLLARTLQLIRSHPGRSLLPTLRFYVDEFQDASALDLSIYEEYPHSRLFIVGDPDQSIYEFRGGSPINMLRYQASASQHTLSTNFRSGKNIVFHASTLIAHNKLRLPITMTAATEEDGEVSAYLEDDGTTHDMRVSSLVSRSLAAGIDPKEIAVLCRTNEQVTEMQAWLSQRGLITYANTKVAVPDLSRVRTLCALMLNPESQVLSNVEATQRGGAKHVFGPPPTTVTKLLEQLYEQHAFSDPMKTIIAEIKLNCPDDRPQHVFNYLRNREVTKKGNGVQVGTMHWSKGQEFRTVIIAHADTADNETMEEEDRRLFYVALTRAKLECYIVGMKRRYVAFKGLTDRSITPFVSEAKINIEPSSNVQSY